MPKKHKQTLPTEEEFLQFKPKQMGFKWETTEEGLVQIIVPKFQSKIGVSFCKFIRKDTEFTANFDKIGSFIWMQCTGKNTVKQIFDLLKKHYPKEKNLDQRLFLFLQQMNNLGYLQVY